MKTLFTPLVIISVFFFFTPVHAASTHHYICSDFGFNSGGSTCSNGDINITANGHVCDGDSNCTTTGTIVFPFTATTYYLTFTYSGSGNIWIGDQCVANYSFSSSQIDAVMTLNSSGCGLSVIYDRAPAFRGDISNICVSDTLGACAATAVQRPIWFPTFWPF